MQTKRVCDKRLKLEFSNQIIRFLVDNLLLPVLKWLLKMTQIKVDHRLLKRKFAMLRFAKLLESIFRIMNTGI